MPFSDTDERSTGRMSHSTGQMSGASTPTDMLTRALHALLGGSAYSEEGVDTRVGDAARHLMAATQEQQRLQQQQHPQQQQLRHQALPERQETRPGAEGSSSRPGSTATLDADNVSHTGNLAGFLANTTGDTPSLRLDQVVGTSLAIPNWSKGKMIGSGAFGAVYCCLNHASGGYFAAKELKILDSTEDKTIEAIIVEVHKINPEINLITLESKSV